MTREHKPVERDIFMTVYPNSSKTSKNFSNINYDNFKFQAEISHTKFKEQNNIEIRFLCDFIYPKEEDAELGENIFTIFIQHGRSLQEMKFLHYSRHYLKRSSSKEAIIELIVSFDKIFGHNDLMFPTPFGWNFIITGGKQITGTKMEVLINKYYLDTRNINLHEELVSDLDKKLWTSRAFSDHVLTCDNTRFKVHKCVLGVQSPVFAAAFECDSLQDMNEMLEVKSIKAAEFQKFLEYMYIRKVPEFDKDILGVYKAAKKYRIEALMYFCEVLILQNINEDNSMDILEFANQTQNDRIKKLAFDTVCIDVFPDIVLPKSAINLPHLIKKIIDAKNKRLDDIKHADQNYERTLYYILNQFKNNAER